MKEKQYRLETLVRDIAKDFDGRVRLGIQADRVYLGTKGKDDYMQVVRAGTTSRKRVDVIISIDKRKIR